MLEVVRGSGVPVEVAVGVEVGTAIVMPTVLQRLSVKAMVSSVTSDEFTRWMDQTDFVNLLDCSRSRRLGGAN